jgi:hypothetical protein
MKSARRSILVSGLVLVLLLCAGGDARAQYGFEGLAGNPWGGPFGMAYGNSIGYGFSPYGFGSYGAGFDGFVGFPMPGFAESAGEIPLTMMALPGLSFGVTATPGWEGPVRSVPRHRVRRRR